MQRSQAAADKHWSIHVVDDAGDTINTASRMESTSFPMSVQLSEAAVQEMRVPEDFCPLGRRAIKGKGIMSTYLLKVCPGQSLPFQQGDHQNRVLLSSPATPGCLFSAKALNKSKSLSSVHKEPCACQTLTLQTLGKISCLQGYASNAPGAAILDGNMISCCSRKVRRPG